MKAYLANGLFSQADRDFNEKVAKEIRNKFYGIDLYVPQQNMEINDKSKIATSQDIANADMEKLMESDCLVAIIDGVEIDSGVAAEIGAFSTLGLPIYALCTDIRFNNDNIGSKTIEIMKDPFENQIMYRNLFVTGLIKNSGGGIYNCIEDLINDI